MRLFQQHQISNYRFLYLLSYNIIYDDRRRKIRYRNYIMTKIDIEIRQK